MGAYTPNSVDMNLTAPVTDPWNFVAISAVMLAVGLFATYFPARRATQIDPLVALREA